jgi:hypothetical protein
MFSLQGPGLGSTPASPDALRLFLISITEDETMKKRVAKKKKPHYYTIGVRFLSSVMVARVYTYKMRSRTSVYLGQELVADSPQGPAVVVVVRVDKVPQDNVYGVEYKFIEKKVSDL